MADKRLTQSPRALRETTNDPEKYSKGDVQLGMKEPSRSGDPENRGAARIADDGERYTPKY
jgi:hypothetical protein